MSQENEKENSIQTNKVGLPDKYRAKKQSTRKPVQHPKQLDENDHKEEKSQSRRKPKQKKKT